MADQQHVNLVKRAGPDFSEWRADHPDTVLDVSGVNFAGMQLGNANLSGANLRGADLSQLRVQHVNFAGADLTSACLEQAHFPDGNFAGANLLRANLRGTLLQTANFQDANLSGADFTGANLTDAKLAGARITDAIFKSASLHRAAVDPQQVSQAQISGASLEGLDLSGIDLSSRDLTGTNFSRAKLSGGNFLNAKLEGATFTSAQLENANFYEADLTRANLGGAELIGANLCRAKLVRAHLVQANLNKADIDGADFYEAMLGQGSMELAKGASSARNLLSTKIDGDVLYFVDVERSWSERFVDWERIRVAGRLPLFGASYTGLIIIPIYVYVLGIYNDKVAAARAWITHTAGTASGLPSNVANMVLAHLHPERPPGDFFILFISTIFLAIASTIYILRCPSRIKTFSRDQWCDELGHSLVHYWPEAWKFPALRLTCATLYLLGGLGAGHVLLTKLWRVGVILYHWS